jgi:hypothetical protein
VPGGTGTEGNAGGGNGDEAVWRDLVARFDTPAPADETPPWPDREDLSGPVRVGPTIPPTLPDTLPREPPTNPTGVPGLPVIDSTVIDNTVLGNTGLGNTGLGNTGLGNTGLGNTGLDDTVLGSTGLGSTGLGDTPTMPDQPWPRLPAAWLGGGIGPRDAPIVENPAEDHYIPPLPPPLPRLDPVTKGAWLALFGGPLYLLINTAIGNAISGLSAFLAVAAFVGGFIVLVLRMDNGRPPDSGSDDDGAVV